MTFSLPAELWPLFFRLAGDGDAQRILTLAAEEGLAPLLVDREYGPSEARPQFANANAMRSLHLRRMELQQKAARTLVDVIGKDECIFLKGFDYRHRLYPRPELRPSADVDVLVPAKHVNDAVKRLTRAGFPQVISAHGIVWAPGIYEVSIDIDNVRIEIHRSLSHRIRTTVDYEEVWRASEHFEAGGVSGRRLAPLHAIAYHALNLAKDELCGPIIRFVDLWLMLQRWPQLVPDLVEQSKRWQVERAMYGSLRIATTLFSELRTDALIASMDSLLTPRARHFMDTNVIPDRRAVTSGHIDGRAKQLWRKYWLTDRLWRRLAFIGVWAWLISSARVQEARSRGGVARYRAARLRGEHRYGDMKVVLFASGGLFSRMVFHHLAEADVVDAVVVPDDRSVMRRAVSRIAGGSLRTIARKHRVPVIAWRSDRVDELTSQLIHYKDDLFCAVSFPFTLPAPVLNLSHRGAVNLHSSLLPRHRGEDPLFWTFFDDDDETGVTLHWMDAGVNTGDIIEQKSMEVTRGISEDELTRQLASAAADLLLSNLRDVNHQPRRPQNPALGNQDPLRTTARPNLGEWPVERVWHFLRGTGTLQLIDPDGRAIVAGDATTYTESVHSERPATARATRNGVRLFCRDGWVDLAAPTLRRRLRRAVLG